MDKEMKVINILCSELSRQVGEVQPTDLDSTSQLQSRGGVENEKGQSPELQYKPEVQSFDSGVENEKNQSSELEKNK